jgi:spore germination protein KB
MSMLDQPLVRRQAIALISLFIFGSSAVVGVSTTVAQDAWIALLMGFLGSIPVLLIYARVMKLNPGEDIFRIFEKTTGKAFGRIMTLFMTWYALHLCALVMRNFSEFLMITALPETPQIPVLAVMLVTVGLLAKSGGKALGKWAVIAWPVVIGMVMITVVMSFNIYQYDNILPVFEHRITEIAKSSFQVFSFPFTETVIFLGIADCFDVQEGPYRAYLWGASISAVILLVVTFRNLFVLGPIVMTSSYFPSYMAARIIAIGNFISRIEGSISVNFILAGIVKITLCLIVASRGLAILLGVENWRNLVFPAGFVALALSQILYGSTMQMYAFLVYYPFYALPFEVLLPVLIWIFSEVHARRKKQAQIAAGAV